MEKRVLCDRCASTYYDAGYNVEEIRPLRFDECDLCSKKGVERIIELRKKKVI